MFNRLPHTTVFIFLFFTAGILNSKEVSKKDSLFSVLKNAKHDTVRISIYHQLGREMSFRSNDSALIFYNNGLEICKDLIYKKDLSLKIQKLEGNILRDYGNFYIPRGEYEKALEYETKALALLNLCSDKEGMELCYKSIGAIRFYQGDAVRSIKAFQSAMKIAEGRGDRASYADCLNNIGMVHYQQDNNDIALTDFKKALEIRKELGIKPKIAESYNNIGMIYSDRSDPKALDYFFEALKIFNELNEIIPLGRIYNNIGIVYRDMSDIENAEKYFLLSLENRSKVQDLQGVALVLSNLSNIATTKGNYKRAIELADSSLAIAIEIGSLQVESNAYGNLYDVYEKMGNYKKALEYHVLLKSRSDSLNSVLKFEAISDIEAKYENEKKELQIENLNKENELRVAELAKSEEKRNKQIIIIYSFVGGFIIILVFSIVILRLFMQKKKANRLLAEQKQQIEFQNLNLMNANEEISAQRDEIEAQKDEITAQRDLVIEQKEHITEQKKKIEDSIRYAKRIQNAVLPADQYFSSILGEHFIIFRPKDVVSGDFYWATTVNDWLIVTVADCTGHGVPGAFMSMLGVSFLNEIVRKKEVTNAASVLNHLRASVIDALKQHGMQSEQKDGMDISLAAINTKTLKCLWAGANNPLYIVPGEANTKHETLNPELIEIKGDSMPVSVHVVMKDFTNHEFQLNKGDKLYMFSDGMPDQFGGSNGRKFLYKRFKKVIEDSSHLPMKEQGIEIEKELDNWMNDNNSVHEQVDDITILGIKI